MKTRNMLTLIVFGGVVALTACSSSDNEDKLGSSQDFCTERSTAECKNLAASCGATEALCKDKRANICNTAAAAAATQGRSYRPNAAQDCLDKIESVFKEKVITAEGDAEVAAVCDRVYGGSKKANDACGNTFECDAGLICDRDICVKPESVTLKGQCNNAGQVCEKGTYCQAQGSTKFCVEKNTANETCNDNAPCIESLRCAATCQPKIAVGETCAADSDCAPEAPYCDPLQSKCRPKYQAGTDACKQYGSQL